MSGQSQQKQHQLGVLFVHGIGEQPRGDTLLRFGDPCIMWLERWLESQGRQAYVERVQTTEDVPTSISMVCDGESKKILFREAWWAKKFAPPAVHDLSWWLLLVGTWATLSHSVKAVRWALKENRSPLIPYLRAAFVYVPVAFSFQIVVIMLSLLGAIPLAPWRDAVANLMRRLSQTLGDSYVLLNSPTQRRMAIASVTADVTAMADACDRTMIVAHSQGAYIAHEALSAVKLPRDRVYFLSVGSGLDKLAELKELNSALEFRGVPDSIGFRRSLYVIPAAFVIFWVVILLGFVLGWHGSTIAFVWVGMCLFVALIPVGYRIKVPSPSVPGCEWHDIYASSDPVPNGPTEGVGSTRIVNEKSLLKDHTTYFTNNLDFIPRVLSRMHSWGGIDWIGDIGGSKDGPLETFTKDRARRKTMAQISKWLNFACFVGYEVYRHKGWQRVYDTVKDTWHWVGSRVLGTGPSEATPDIQPEPWLMGVLAFVLCDLVIRWSDRTSDRTYTNLLFQDDRWLRGLGAFLFWLIPAAPLVVWGCAVAWVMR